MKKQILILSLLIVALTSCSSPKMDEEQVTGALIVEEGIIGGISINDSWEDVKKLNTDFWKVREEGTITQLRKDWDDFNHMSLSVELSQDKKVKEIVLDFNGRDENRVLITSIYNKLIKSYDIKFKKEESNSWSLETKDGNVYINLDKNESDDSKDLWISSSAF